MKNRLNEAQTLVQSCEDYLDLNSKSVPDLNHPENSIINPFFELKMYNPESEEEQKRKLSSVSDIRDSIKETHEDVSYKTVPRIHKAKNRPYAFRVQDGTESVSSFVALTPGHSHSTLSSGSSEWSNSDEKEDQKGFVNKYFTRVKNSLVKKN